LLILSLFFTRPASQSPFTVCSATLRAEVSKIEKAAPPARKQPSQQEGKSSFDRQTASGKAQSKISAKTFDAGMIEQI
jgi:hypothetical protein